MGLDSPTTDDAATDDDPDAGDGADEPNALAKLKRDALITSLAGLMMPGLAIVTSPLTARALEPAGRGDLAAVVAPTSIMAWVLAFGLPNASMYFAKRFTHRQLVMGAWATAGLLGGVFTAAVWFLVPHYLHSHADITVPWMRAYLCVSALWVVSYVAIDLQLSRGGVIAYNVLRLLPFVLNFVGVVALFLTHHLDLNTSLASQFFAYVIWMVVVFTYAKAWPGRGFRREVLRLQLQYGSRVAPGTIAENVVSRFDQVLLAPLVASEKLGIYAIAAVIAGISQQVAYAISSTVFPRIVAAHHTDGAQDTAKQAMRLNLFASLLGTVLLLVATPIVIPWVYGSAYSSAVWLVMLLLPGQICQNVAIVLGGRLQALGHPQVSSQGAAIAAAVTLVGLLLTVSPFGTVGAAITTSVSQLVNMVYVMARERRLRGVAPRTSAMASA